MVSGDEIISDSYPLKEIDDVVYEIDCKKVTKAGDDNFGMAHHVPVAYWSPGPCDNAWNSERLDLGGVPVARYNPADISRYRRQPFRRRGRGGCRRFQLAGHRCRRCIPAELPWRRGFRHSSFWIQEGLRFAAEE
jgi:Translationally controlled tumour protein